MTPVRDALPFSDALDEYRTDMDVEHAWQQLCRWSATITVRWRRHDDERYMYAGNWLTADELRHLLSWSADVCEVKEI